VGDSKLSAPTVEKSAFRNAAFETIELASGAALALNEVMSKASYGMAMWPGFIPLWQRGELYSLFVALLFAVLLNLALLSTLVWDAWLSSWLVKSLWLSIFVACTWSCISELIIGTKGRQSVSDKECDQLLQAAQRDYLRGEYVEAEAGLHRILASGREDMESALLLATLMRRTGRSRQAGECLDRLERFERAGYWALEIQRERSKLSTVEA
jgi:hypothetical protein